MSFEKSGASLPQMINLTEVGRRLRLIFPESFPNRGLLVGAMAQRAVFVFLYGGFVEGSGRYLRPSHVYLFTDKQARMTAEQERNDWVRLSAKPGFRPAGKRWYAGDNSRETLRDDLIRNQLMRLGIVKKLSGIPGRSSKPTFFLSSSFAFLFSPNLRADLNSAIEEWRAHNLSQATLQQMALIAEGLRAKAGDYLVNLPDGTRIRLAAGPSSLLVRDLIERFAPAYLREPALIWLSEGDSNAVPIFERAAASIGLQFESRDILPDLILADLSSPPKLLFCEVVASDGPITEARREELMRMVRKSEISETTVQFLTAYESRSSLPFKKTFPVVDLNSFVWFRTEPTLLVQLSELLPIASDK